MSNIRSRLGKAADKSVTAYTASIPYDWRLYRYDIRGNIAHARMLAKQGIITGDEAKIIIRGLNAIEKEIEQGKLQFKPELEDIHMNIESRLIEKVGKVGGKLHTARSRNDQIALDMRLFVQDATVSTIAFLIQLQIAVVRLAEAHQDVIMPGYTHLQPAQPVLLAHHLLAYYEMFQRDVERFWDCLTRTDVMPLGSGALAGVPYNIDRKFVAKELGFSQVSQNSIDAVSDRDFIVEYEAAASLCMMHLSRLAEEIILWSTSEFGFIELDDAYSTGSSIMPQKKNPDVAELARGRTGRVYGHLMAMLTALKGLPLSYNRDLQEDKEGLFDTVDVLLSTIDVFTGMLQTLKVRPERMAQAVNQAYLLATDLADYLVRKGEVFRSAHDSVGRLVRYAIEKNRAFNEMTLSEYQQFSPLFAQDVYDINVQSSIAARNNPGGTAPEQVKKALAAAKRALGIRKTRAKAKR